MTRIQPRDDRLVIVRQIQRARKKERKSTLKRIATEVLVLEGSAACTDRPVAENAKETFICRQDGLRAP
jgi:hypothetical protein